MQDRNHFDAAHNRGVCLERRGDLRGAWAAYTDAVRVRPEGAHAYQSRGNICRDLGDLEGAVADWSAALSRESPTAPLLSKRAAALLSLRRDDEAYRDYTRVLELDPKDAEAYLGRAEVWRRRGDAAGVRRNLEAALGVAPRGWAKRRAVEAQVAGGSAQRTW
jgi:tetratricopeptide (TPR) repeat protein